MLAECPVTRNAKRDAGDMQASPTADNACSPVALAGKAEGEKQAAHMTHTSALSLERTDSLLLFCDYNRLF